MSRAPAQGPQQIDVGQLLLIDPNAYINLTLQFPDASYDEKNPPRTLEDIKAYVLPSNFRLMLVSANEAVLVCKSPPAIFAYDKETFTWKPVQVVVPKK